MKTRMHPSVIAENLLSSIWVIIIIVFYIINQIFEDNPSQGLENTRNFISAISTNIFISALLILLVILIIFTIFFYIKWKNTYLYFKDNNIIIEKGKLFKKITTINIKDIATINIKRNIVEQILNTSNLKIELNTSNTEIHEKLVFRQDKAQNIKDKILKTTIQKTKENAKINSIINYKPIDVFRHMLLSINIKLILTLIIIYSFILISDFNKISNISTITLIIIIILGIGPLIWKIIKDYLSYYNFKVSRDGETIKLSYGAFTNYRYSLSIKKINAIIIKQSLQARLTGYYTIEVVNAGIGNENKEDEKTIIGLYVKNQEKNLIINSIVPEYNNQIKLIDEPKNSLYHHLLNTSPLIIITLLLIPYIKLISLLIIIILLSVTYAKYKNSKIGFDKKQVIVQNGILDKKITIIKFNNIELINLDKLLFTNLFKTYKISFNIIGPTQNSHITSGLFKKDILETIINTYLGEENENKLQSNNGRDN